MHVHHPPQNKGDSYHVVALTSTTLGSLELVSHSQGNGFVPYSTLLKANNTSENGFEVGKGFMFSNGKVSENFKEEVENEVKTWSNMIEEKLPKSIAKNSITTPPCEDIINTWELMEGLEDTSPFQSPNQLRSFSFDVNVNGHVDPSKTSFMENDDGIDLHKPKLDHMIIEDGSNDLNLNVEVLNFDDCKVVSSFKKPLQEKQEAMDAKRFFFEEKNISDNVVNFKIAPYEKKEKAVLYFTSLRMVRKTYEDCCIVRMVLKGLGIRVDERDVSMHLGFKEELKELLGEGNYGKGGLPKVFIGRKYIGGVEEIQKLHDDKKLEKLFDCCERVDDIEGGDGGCEACGDIKFVPCEKCYGSCKIYYEGDYEEDDDYEVGECGFQRCPHCNENGLTRCSMCCF
ncbi:glutaredoxin family protein [Medicago truncatula]|uniref:Glutaredoxin family protein n=2 Tax=Medicago truncatula TaxID=3880 RepID=A0A072U5G4_MEDTR|nr:glutaredoxin family protein [Medicago truncatula]